jgi:hypothetical protein
MQGIHPPLSWASKSQHRIDFASSVMPPRKRGDGRRRPVAHVATARSGLKLLCRPVTAKSPPSTTPNPLGAGASISDVGSLALGAAPADPPHQVLDGPGHHR